MAPMRLMRAAIPGMVERGWGRVVNVVLERRQAPIGRRCPSTRSPRPPSSRSRGCSPTATPADGVLVNAICPGPTKSELWMDEGGLLDQAQALAGHDSREQALDAAGASRPIGRLAESEEIAAAIVFLCSERASYVAGAAWSVDGGTVQVII